MQFGGPQSITHIVAKNQTLEEYIRAPGKSIIVSMATSFDVTAGESLGKNGRRAAARCLGVY